MHVSTAHPHPHAQRTRNPHNTRVPIHNASTPQNMRTRSAPMYISTVHPHPQHINPQPHCIRTRSVPVDGATCMRSACAPAQHMCTYPQRIHTRKACAHAVHPCTYPQWTVHPHPQHTNPQPHCIRTRSVPVDGATCMRSAYAPAEHPCTYPQRTHTRTRTTHVHLSTTHPHHKACVHAVHPCTYPQCTHTRSTRIHPQPL